MPELPVFVFSLEPANDDAIVYSRMFAPVFGIAEDPATGGAGGPLGGYLVSHGVVSAKQAEHLINLQGVQMGRPSRIHISIRMRDTRIDEVRVGGRRSLSEKERLRCEGWNRRGNRAMDRPCWFG